MKNPSLRKGTSGNKTGKRNTKKSTGHFLQKRTEYYEFIKSNERNYSVIKMCKVLHISNSAYYRWRKCPDKDQSPASKALEQKVVEVYNRSHKRYGSPRIKAELNNNGLQISLKTVAKIMRRRGLKSIVRKRYRVCTTDSTHSYPVSENLLNRNFSTDLPSRKWVSDLTYIPTYEGWLYVTIVMDLFDRKIIGWSFSSDMRACNTTVSALQMALINRSAGKEMLFYSDRGVQYACELFRKKIASWNITQSMSRKGNCWDNAPSESFFKTLKTELVYQQTFRTRKEAESAIFDFIEIWYNRKRRHSSLNYQTPYEKEIIQI
ncbi:IS3 family transposase [Arachidicoccus soli]|uniref:IS3 family transposase n=1 Tax=Arachidicoccus soli TaxID=2341117 RepID=A0A386HLH1_9BACT|nr:IS3 family transposase [Arachidicoccus soli]AYD46469.1 IS3 family transposase [Arachidicoccus soli]